MIRLRLLNEEHKEGVRNALLLKHVHQHEKEFQKQLSNGEKKPFPFVKSLADMGKKMSHLDMKAADTGTSTLNQVPSSNLLTPSNVSSANLRQSNTQAIFELSGSQAKISKVDSKAKVFSNTISI